MEQKQPSEEACSLTEQDEKNDFIDDEVHKYKEVIATLQQENTTLKDDLSNKDHNTVLY